MAPKSTVCRRSLFSRLIPRNQWHGPSVIWVVEHRRAPRGVPVPKRTARTAWNGSLQEGGGQVELTSSGVGTFDVSFPKRAAEDADGTTSPEELIAAAHSSCYAMQLSALIAEAGGTPQSLDVTA